MPTITVGQALKIARDHYSAKRFDEAEAACRKLLAQAPDQPDALAMLGYLLSRRNAGEGIAMMRRGIEINPNNPQYHNNLGCVLGENDQHEQAIECYRRAIALRPQYAEAQGNLASTLRMCEKLDEALAAARQAVEVDPASYRSWMVLGDCLQSNRRLAEAEQAFRKALELKPDNSDAFTKLGLALRDQSRFDEAGRAFRRSIAIKPDAAASHWNYALTLLRSGNYRDGFLEYEWRWLWDGFPGKPRSYAQPLWLGSDLAGKTLLVYAEQGLGDSIQMARYIPLLAARGASVILQCYSETRRLLGSLNGVSELVSLTEEPPARFDLHVPMMSLPLAFGTVVETIPAQVPYLHAEAGLMREWATRMQAPEGYLKVGLAWAGQPRHGDDRRRSVSLAALAPLTRAGSAQFFSLQKGPGAEQIAQAPPGLALTDVGAKLNDFADTAAMIANLDLVITVDTAVAHLAGAMGKPCWVLIWAVPDWRWMLDREDSPWYPSIRLFRQSPGQSWDPVIARVADELAELCRRSPSQKR